MHALIAGVEWAFAQLKQPMATIDQLGGTSNSYGLFIVPNARLYIGYQLLASTGFRCIALLDQALKRKFQTDWLGSLQPHADQSPDDELLVVLVRYRDVLIKLISDAALTNVSLRTLTTVMVANLLDM
jgi:hypothetical protein